MSISRRGILRLLPGLPAAARAAQQATAEMMTGVTVSPPIDPYATDEYVPRSRRGRKLIRLLKELGLPDWKKRELRGYARRRRILDPDIASMRSVSLSGKLNMQWRRNEQQAHASLFDNIIDEEDREAFYKRHDADYF